MSVSFLKNYFAVLFGLVCVSFFSLVGSVQADRNHDGGDRIHNHCADGSLAFVPETCAEDNVSGDSNGDPCAGIPNTVSRGGICLPTSENLGIQDDPVENILLSVTLFVTGLIGVLAVLMIVVSGVMYMLSAGDTARVESSKKILTYSIIGLVVALLAWVIVSVVSRVTGAGGLEANNPDGPVTGVMVEVCPTPDFCFMVENNQ